MKLFRRDIEVALKTAGVVTLIALIAVPLAWGYEQDRRARKWQSVACAYRIKELTRGTVLTLEGELPADACSVLTRLGFPVDAERLEPPSVRRVTSRN